MPETAETGLRYDLEVSVGYLLNRAASIVAARFSDDLKPHGINLQAWRILATLSYQDHQSLTDLASHTGAELSYLTRSVAALEERQLLTRHPSPLDRRAVLLSLTPTGRTLVQSLIPQRDNVEATSLQGIPKADIDATFRTLRAIYHNLVESSNAAGVNRKLTIARRARKRKTG